MIHPSPQQTFDEAVRLHQSGKLQDAERLYRQILTRKPNHSGATQYLAMIASQTGRHDLALELLRRAIALNPTDPELHNNLGNALTESKLLPAAIAAYRQATALRPNFAEAHYNLANALTRNQQFEEAIAAYGQAIALRPNYAEAHNNLGNALKRNHQFDEAVSAYRRAIALRPNLPEAHGNLANAFAEMKQFDDAIASYRQAIALKPNYAEAHSNLGAAYLGNGQLDDAIAAYRQAVAFRPDYPIAHYNLGNALARTDQLDAAIASLRRSIALRPDFPEAHYDLGNVLKDKGQFEDAILAYRQAIALKPNYPEALYNLGNALIDTRQYEPALTAYRQAIVAKPDFAEAHYNLANALTGKRHFDQAIAEYRQALALQPNYPDAQNNLGNALKDRGQLDEALDAYRQALALNPDFKKAHGNLIFALHYHPAHDAQSILHELRRFNQQHAHPLAKFIQPHANDRAPDRPLRVGYVSPDFRDHVIGRNLLPLLRRHDRQLFEITCYSSVPRPDAFTRQFQQAAHHWRDIVKLTDEQIAGQIRDDHIDILIDLALFMSTRLLMVFARKPAPIHATFGGYPGSTGLDTIDYRLTDPHLDPPGETDQFYSEKSIRLPHSFWCYDPIAMDAPTDPVNPLPALQNGYITFGCLNNFCKVNDQVLELWSAVMRRVPNSRLILLVPTGQTRQRIQQIFQRLQITPDRLELIDLLPREKYLQVYRRIDIGLETFPYNGHTTSLDSLWMGVPVITLQGKTVVGRAGRSQLTNLNLPELIAKTPEEYIQIVANLASDIPRLSHLRQTLRQRMQNSPLCDAEKFTLGVESAYRQMWLTWCQS
ncbi:MAG: tetratricopeptide repeat protein [Tepidisphaeraceae bacterium]